MEMGRYRRREAKKGGNREKEQYCCLENRFERNEEQGEYETQIQKQLNNMKAEE